MTDSRQDRFGEHCGQTRRCAGVSTEDANRRYEARRREPFRAKVGNNA